jgi:hypothetical protein
MNTRIEEESENKTETAAPTLTEPALDEASPKDLLCKADREEKE